MKKYLIRPKKTTHLLHATLFSTMLISHCFAATLPAAKTVSTLSRFLDPTAMTLTVNENQCFFAAPTYLLQVQPIISNSGERVYRISHIADSTLQKKLYDQPLDEQIRNRQIVGREFCNGVVAMSNLDIPFSKDETLLDENDGLLLVDTTRHAMLDVTHILRKMSVLADEAANGAHSSGQLEALNEEFQQQLDEIDHISKSVTFNGNTLLDGKNESFHIPKKNGEDITIAMQNATTGSAGFNIINLNLSSNASANYALSAINSALSATHNSLNDLNSTEDTLVDAIHQDADITSVDVSNDDFVVRHQKSYPTATFRQPL